MFVDNCVQDRRRKRCSLSDPLKRHQEGLMSFTCIQNPTLNIHATGPILYPSLADFSPMVCPEAKDLGSSLSESAAKRGRPCKPRYVCPSCARLTRLTKSYCCEHCGRPRIPAGINGPRLLDAWIKFVASYSWTHCGTGTFAWDLDATREHHRLAVQNYIHRYFKRLQRWFPSIAWFAVGEPTQKD